LLAEVATIANAGRTSFQDEMDLVSRLLRLPLAGAERVKLRIISYDAGCEDFRLSGMIVDLMGEATARWSGKDLHLRLSAVLNGKDRLSPDSE
jgi:hypothetical protein